jgi:hypothetical protein
MPLDTKHLNDAAKLRYIILLDPEKVEYVCRAALLLRDLEYVNAFCPVCKGATPVLPGGGHQRQCDLAGALDMLDNMLKEAT